MIPNLPTIGVRFDIEKVGCNLYGLACWKIFWQAINPEEIGVASLYHGDIFATINDPYNVFYIAVQSLDSKAIAKIKAKLIQNEAFKRVCATPNFVEGSFCGRERLPDVGRIDAEGNLVGDAGLSRCVLGEAKKERKKAMQAAEDVQIPERSKPASDRTRTLPTLSSFDELKTFIGKTFTPKEQPKAFEYWMTLEELCDIVDRYAEMIRINYCEYSCDISEDICRVILLKKNPTEGGTIGFIGLYPFASVLDARSYGQDLSFNNMHVSLNMSFEERVEYAKMMPLYANVRGKYHFNFHFYSSHGKDGGEIISPESLWGRLYLRKQRFLDDLPDTEKR